jgi:DNA polymerase III alpha subunit|tara:strand:+ start:3271 stop:3849 length:579 start_codon:yes stop_codon:yes gene_type:complete
MIVNTDIDIDVANRDKLLKLIRNTPAMISRDGKQVKHNTGVYFHEIPEDPYTGISTVDHKTAEKIGYFKLDILNVNLYDKIESKEQLDTLLDMEPMWDLLEHKDIVEGMFHIHRHYDIVNKMKPQSIEQLAAVLAIIRPAKRNLLGKSWDKVMSEVWVKPSDDSYYFKKAHATAYAMAIVVQMNQIVKDFSS